MRAVCLSFREVKNHLNYEHRVFNSEEFLKTRAPGDQRFYKQVGACGPPGPRHAPSSQLKRSPHNFFAH